MLAALFFLPTIRYAQKRFGLFPTHHERLSKSSRTRNVLSRAGFILTIVRVVGLSNPLRSIFQQYRKKARKARGITPTNYFGGF